MNIINGYEEIEFIIGCSIENAVDKLLSYNKKVYGIFNGHVLYSDTVTLDSAYREITGISKEEYDKREQERVNEYEKQKREHEQKIPELTKEWIEKGHAVLSEDKWKYWEKCVPIRLTDLYQGMELGCCLDIIEKLQNGDSFESVKNYFDSQGHSGMSFGLVCSMIKSFYDNGSEFVEYARK